jgi:hypothetical protein
LSDIEVVELLGGGNFGEVCVFFFLAFSFKVCVCVLLTVTTQVYLGKWNRFTNVALKKVKKEQVSELENEASMLK